MTALAALAQQTTFALLVQALTDTENDPLACAEWIDRGIPASDLLRLRRLAAADLARIATVPGVLKLSFDGDRLSAALTARECAAQNEADLEALLSVRAPTELLLRLFPRLSRRAIAVQRLALGIAERGGRPPAVSPDAEAAIRESWRDHSALPEPQRWLALAAAFEGTPLSVLYRVIRDSHLRRAS